MAIADSPANFRYISKRLTREIVQESHATTRRRSWSLGLDLKLLTLAVIRQRPDYRNRYEMAQRATEAVKDKTGSLAYPGDYIQAEADLRCCYFPVHLGWDEVANAEIAAFVIKADLLESGRTFMALIGSIGNYVGRKRRDSANGGGWCPSDVMGLYDVLRLGLEPSDPRLSSIYVAEDLPMSDDARFSAAMTIFGNVEDHYPPRRLAFLAKVHHYATDLEFYKRQYDTVLLGAPIWVAEPPPVPLATFRGE